MKVVLVHDYLREFGGAERVLKVLSEIYPKAPIYTAFIVKGSTAEKEFRDKKIHESWLAPILKFGKLYSPLRFLIPFIWGSMDLSKYDLVITSCSWYVTRGFKIGPRTRVIAYCHTPPRWLYGFETSVRFTKYWPVKIYSNIVGNFVRKYDFKTAQLPARGLARGFSLRRRIYGGVDYFVANSKNVQARIKKFYGRDSVVIYPPIDVSQIEDVANRIEKKEDFFLIVSRLVGAKGLEKAAEAFRNLPYRLKIVGEAHGFSDVEKRLRSIAGRNIELLGRVSDEDLWGLYAEARGFIALAKDEDFGMTVVEAMAAGTPVIAFNGGGFKETVIDGVTGILIEDTDVEAIKEAIEKLLTIRWDKRILQRHARKFSVQRFKKELTDFVYRVYKG
jgi:glycosyltransferase involved in cell wall biosynthesis